MTDNTRAEEIGEEPESADAGDAAAEPDVAEQASPEEPPDPDESTAVPGSAGRFSARAGPRLYRSEQTRILGGVAGGIGEYFDTDPVIVRLLWVLATAVGGAGILAYLILWIVVPPYSRVYGEAQPVRESAGQTGRSASTRRAPVRLDLVFGGILIVLGGMLLVGSLDLGPSWDIFGRLWPLLLIVPGAVIAAPRGGRWPSTGVLLVGGVLLAVGLINLPGSLDIWWGYDAWGRLWPLVLVAIGAAFVFPRVDRRD